MHSQKNIYLNLSTELQQQTGSTKMFILILSQDWSLVI